MMDLLAMQPIFTTMWVVWFFVLFIGIILYVMSPKRKRGYERAGGIPLRNDPPHHLS